MDNDDIKIKCSKCKNENSMGTHYCNNCGANLTDQIEKSDFLGFLYKFCLVGGLFILFNPISLLYFAFVPLASSIIAYGIIIVGIFAVILSFVFKSKYKKELENNLSKK